MNKGHKIAVAGASGRVGHHLVEILEAGGHDVVAMSRSTGVDVITREGLADALTGVDVIVDAAGGSSSDQHEATDFFVTSARNLQEAGERAGVSRIVVVSIIGADRFTAGYNVAKIAHEETLKAGPVPVQVLRAAQFHELFPLVVEWGRQGDVSYVQKMRTQPVAARNVAEALADLALRADGPAYSEIAGPREESSVELATRLCARRGDPVRIEGVSYETDHELFEAGALLPGPEAALAGPTFEEWLAASAGWAPTNRAGAAA
jgi:uncharacterized protein YbjT (DUF2867 family)